MRHLVMVTLGTARANIAACDGSLGRTISAILGERRPEVAEPCFVDARDEFHPTRPDGSTPFATEPRLRDATCWGCHATVADDDWVFTSFDAR
jgi:hypothetical protein